MLHRRLVLAGAGSALLARPALAQPAWVPTRPIQCIVGFAPGGGTDLIARAIVEAAQPLFPVPLVVVNQPGAGGTIAAQRVTNAPPDGHTLLMGGGSESTSIPVFRQLPYDSRNGFRCILRLLQQRLYVLMKTGGNHAGMREMVAAARAAPGTVTHGSSGVGSSYHAVYVVLEKRAGIELLHVPFTGGAPGLQALIGGQIDSMVAATEEFRGMADGGLLRPVAVTSADRSQAYPDVPTLKELGWDVVIDNMKGWMAPAGTPDAVVAYLHDRFRQAMQSAVWTTYLQRTGEPSAYLDGPSFQRAIDSMMDSIAEAVGNRPRG